MQFQNKAMFSRSLHRALLSIKQRRPYEQVDCTSQKVWLRFEQKNFSERDRQNIQIVLDKIIYSLAQCSTRPQERMKLLIGRQKLFYRDSN